jgi:mono/diheme cytochrome c family protein
VLAPFSRFVVAATLLTACQQAPADLREWRPGDHTNTGETGAMQKGQVKAEAAPTPAGLDQVTLSTWQNNCVSCHGRAGAGDGPQAPMYKPRDLGDPEFQAQVTDAQLLESIQRGKGKMPGFALPEGTAQGLVKLVRLLNREPPPASSAALASPSGAPTVVPASTVSSSAPHGRQAPPGSPPGSGASTLNARPVPPPASAKPLATQGE